MECEIRHRLSKRVILENESSLDLYNLGAILTSMDTYDCHSFLGLGNHVLASKIDAKCKERLPPSCGVKLELLVQPRLEDNEIAELLRSKNWKFGKPLSRKGRAENNGVLREILVEEMVKNGIVAHLTRCTYNKRIVDRFVLDDDHSGDEPNDNENDEDGQVDDRERLAELMDKYTTYDCLSKEELFGVFRERDPESYRAKDKCSCSSV